MESQTNLALSSVILPLVALLKKDQDLFNALAESLKLAKNDAEANLNSSLFKALEWPLAVKNYCGKEGDSLIEYYTFLDEFLHWRPIEEADSAWLAYPGSKLGRALGTQEIYDRLCHFYFLINQQVNVGESGLLLQDYPPFATWLDNYAITWGAFLSTSQSFSMDEVENFIKLSPLYDVKASLENDEPPYKPVNGPWDSFNDFFARALKPGERPVASPDSNYVVTRPADCTYHEDFPIGPNGEVGDLRIKGMKAPATVGQLLGDDKYNDIFAGGVFVHYFLAPYSYHRFHSPVTGTLSDFNVISHNLIGGQTQAYLAVNIDEYGQFDAPDSSEDGYEFVQTRGYVVVDTSNSDEGDIGLVAAIPVGMCQVSSVVLKDENGYELESGADIKKGEQFGFFQFGGSDIIVLLQKEAYENAKLNKNINEIPGVYTPDFYHYGTEIAYIKDS